MTLTERVQTDAIAALKAGDRSTAGALRMILAALKSAAKEEQADRLSEEAEIAVLRRERKKRIEAADAYTGAGRTDQADAETSEARLIDAYLPAELSDDELCAVVTRAIESSGAASPGDMGKVMKVAMGEVGARADGRRVSALAKRLLDDRPTVPGA